VCECACAIAYTTIIHRLPYNTTHLILKESNIAICEHKQVTASPCPGVD